MQFAVGGELVARSLKTQGVTAIYTLCGGHIAPIYDGCMTHGIDIIDFRHEQAAAHAADAHARLTRGIGVCVVTAGPGVTDAVTGVANAYPARSPLLLIGGAAPLATACRTIESSGWASVAASTRLAPPPISSVMNSRRDRIWTFSGTGAGVT